jgi:menaquinone-dependent protoporphyrinogen oxidase
MRVLVAYSSRCGATQGIAERIADTLRQHGLEATAEAAQEAGDPASYDAAVIGSATYFFHWMKPAAKFVRRNADSLANRPVWLFSSGPLGTKTHNEQGQEMCAVLEPKEIAEFSETVEPREHRVFFGALDAKKLGFLFGLLLKMPANKNDSIFPQGDFRNWAEIDAWASGIAEELKTISL